MRWQQDIAGKQTQNLVSKTYPPGFSLRKINLIINHFLASMG